VELGLAAFGGVGIDFSLGGLWPVDGTIILAAVFLALGLAEERFRHGQIWRQLFVYVVEAGLALFSF